MQYLAWLGRTLTGDFGKSIATQLPVATLVLPRFVNTLILTFSSLLLAIVIGYSVGLFAALRAHSLFDRTEHVGHALLAGSAPPFWLGLILVLLFAIQLRWLPVSGMQDHGRRRRAFDLLRHLVLPTVTTALGPPPSSPASCARRVIEALEKPHVRVARAKGLTREPRSSAAMSS